MADINYFKFIVFTLQALSKWKEMILPREYKDVQKRKKDIIVDVNFRKTETTTALVFKMSNIIWVKRRHAVYLRDKPRFTRFIQNRPISY